MAVPGLGGSGCGGHTPSVETWLLEGTDTGGCPGQCDQLELSSVKLSPVAAALGAAGAATDPPARSAAAVQCSLRDSSSKSGLVAGDPKESICSLFSA